MKHRGNMNHSFLKNEFFAIVLQIRKSSNRLTLIFALIINLYVNHQPK